MMEERKYYRVTKYLQCVVNLYRLASDVLQKRTLLYIVFEKTTTCINVKDAIPVSFDQCFYILFLNHASAVNSVPVNIKKLANNNYIYPCMLQNNRNTTLLKSVARKFGFVY